MCNETAPISFEFFCNALCDGNFVKSSELKALSEPSKGCGENGLVATFVEPFELADLRVVDETLLNFCLMKSLIEDGEVETDPVVESLRCCGLEMEGDSAATAGPSPAFTPPSTASVMFMQG